MGGRARKEEEGGLGKKRNGLGWDLYGRERRKKRRKRRREGGSEGGEKMRWGWRAGMLLQTNGMSYFWYTDPHLSVMSVDYCLSVLFCVNQ